MALPKSTSPLRTEFPETSIFALTSTFPPNVDPLLTLSSFEVVTPETIKSPKTVAPIATTSKCFVLS